MNVTIGTAAADLFRRVPTAVDLASVPITFHCLHLAQALSLLNCRTAKYDHGQGFLWESSSSMHSVSIFLCAHDLIQP